MLLCHLFSDQASKHYDSSEIHIHCLGESFGISLQKFVAVGHARVVYEHVHSSKMSDRRVGRGADAFERREVSRHWKCSVYPDALAYLLQALAVAGHQRELCSGLAKLLCNPPADATRSTGYQDDFAL